mmetsp:Transcript_34745/g.61142  ORF Transcript_34745/g.61142 Transcript_34745/m.61142 type:complete len:147 (+) Transcript_34745:74-514(+)
MCSLKTASLQMGWIDFLSGTRTFMNRTVRLQLWDTAGQERFRSLIPSYLRDSLGVLIFYSIDNRASFDSLRRWYQSTIDESGEKPVIFVGMKSDLADRRAVTYEEGKRLADECKAFFIEASAKDGSNIGVAVDCLLGGILRAKSLV